MIIKRTIKGRFQPLFGNTNANSYKDDAQILTPSLFPDGQ